MCKSLHFISIVVSFYLRFIVNADSSCDIPLLKNSLLTASSSIEDGEPKNATLNGRSAWTADNSDFAQYFSIDFGSTMIVTSISTQGREKSSEYIESFSISYGSNNLDYAEYKELYGNTKVFIGNNNGNDVVRNVFNVPIIAQWIKINPIRWRDKISLRLELYGCPYTSEKLYFNGTSLIRWDLKHSPIFAHKESIKFRFKTNVADGILLYSIGSHGDYLALQLKNNKLILNINLGSKIMTSLSNGGLLDDNTWHEVIIMRNRLDIVFSIDHNIIKDRIKGEFERLDLNREIFIGGVPYSNKGLIINTNFTGCIENLFINTTNIISTIKEFHSDNKDFNQKYQKINILYFCWEAPIVPVTFLTPSSYVKINTYEGIKTSNISLSFRTYEEQGLLVYHKFISNGHLKLYLENKRIKVELVTNDDIRVVLNDYEDIFNDGKWHSVVLTIKNNFLELKVNNVPLQIFRRINIITGPDYYFAGGISGTVGFIGCMRLITVNENYMSPIDWKLDEHYCCEKEVLIDSCQMIDRCSPNPCKHSGICKQTFSEFSCNCKNTGYSGAICQTPLYPLSCQTYKHFTSIGPNSDVQIDIDGSGPLKPFPVTCHYYGDERIVTIVKHQSEDISIVDGFQDSGSFKKDLFYDADLFQIETLINRSHSCWQSISYFCKQSALFNSSIYKLDFQPLGWWVSKHNKKMDYWGDSIPGSYKCQCGILGNCKDPTKWCNCDSGLDDWLSDSGNIRQKEHLPIKQVRFGDTGSLIDNKKGKFEVGSLMCEGDDLFNNVVTFRKPDSQIKLPSFDFDLNSEIYFEFKTTINSNVNIFECYGLNDFIKLKFLNSHSLHFSYQTNSRTLNVHLESSIKLNDNNWHSVIIERNRKESRIIVDRILMQSIREPPDRVYAIHLTSEFIIGASYGEQNGFVGCMRAFMINGQLVDLKSYAEKNVYGISPGCVGKCDSSPCLNNGKCFEKYNSYSCECQWTAFKGPICADEIGVNLKASSMIKYDFNGIWRSTVSENIRVGFTTTNPKGFLLGLYSNISGEYMTIMISNSGSLRVVFDFGFERQELHFTDQHFGLGQYHDLKIKRKNSGSTIVIQIDEGRSKEFHFNVKKSTDVQFNNIQYLYIGRNESMAEGFIGCISRVEFDDIYPLKLLFQQDRPPNISNMNTTVREDFCGIESITHQPPIAETRPPPISPVLGNRPYNYTLISGIISLILIVVFILTLLFNHYVSCHKGNYKTQEDRGADVALNKDEAITNSIIVPRIQKTKEWFV